MKRLPKVCPGNLGRHGFRIEAIGGDKSCAKKPVIDSRRLKKCYGFDASKALTPIKSLVFYVMYDGVVCKR